MREIVKVLVFIKDSFVNSIMLIPVIAGLLFLFIAYIIYEVKAV